MVTPSSRTSVNYRLILFTLSLSTFSAYSPGILTGLLLVDISETFASPVGMVAQIRSFSSVIGVIGAVLLAAFSVRFSYKRLLMFGLSLLGISAIGCCYAPTLSFLFLTYSLTGLGLAMVSPMANALIGDVFPVERRASAIGAILASGALSYVLGAPIIGFLEGRLGWRYTFVVYLFLLNIVALISARMGLPSGQRRYQRAGSAFFEGFKQILKNRSALSCLIGIMIATASWQGILYYGVSFYRQGFLVPTGSAAILLSGLTVFFTAGSILSGRIVDGFGAKRSTAISIASVGLLTMLYTKIPFFWISLALSMTGGLFGGVRLAASNNLSLEQVPGFRGTMMSLSTASVNVGVSLGTFIGGMMLLWYSWDMMGTILGLIGFLAAIIYLMFTVDPFQTNIHT